MSEGKRSVLVCIDESEYAEKAFEFYAKNIWKENDYIVLGFVPELYEFDFAAPKVIDQLLKELSSKCNKLEEKYKKIMSDHKFSGKFRTEKGKPGDAICKMAADEGVTLIVVGSRGQGKLQRAFLGSVSSHVVHHAHVPVLVCNVV